MYLLLVFCYVLDDLWQQILAELLMIHYCLTMKHYSIFGLISALQYLVFCKYLLHLHLKIQFALTMPYCWTVEKNEGSQLCYYPKYISLVYI